MKGRDLSPQPGDILLLRIEGIVGFLVWLAQAFNGDLSRWTHVAVCLDDNTVFEAQPGGAVITELSYYDDRPMAIVTKRFAPERWREGVGNGLTYDLNLHSADRFRIVSEARSRLGIGYNWGTYFYLALHRVGVRPAWIRDRIRRDNRLICSQAADLIYYLVGVDLIPGSPPYEVTPGDLARLTG